MQWFSYLGKREVWQQEYSQPAILPSPHFRWVVKDKNAHPRFDITVRSVCTSYLYVNNYNSQGNAMLWILQLQKKFLFCFKVTTGRSRFLKFMKIYIYKKSLGIWKSLKSSKGDIIKLCLLQANEAYTHAPKTQQQLRGGGRGGVHELGKGGGQLYYI